MKALTQTLHVCDGKPGRDTSRKAIGLQQHRVLVAPCSRIRSQLVLGVAIQFLQGHYIGSLRCHPRFPMRISRLRLLRKSIPDVVRQNFQRFRRLISQYRKGTAQQTQQQPRPAHGTHLRNPHAAQRLTAACRTTIAVRTPLSSGEHRNQLHRKLQTAPTMTLEHSDQSDRDNHGNNLESVHRQASQDLPPLTA